MKKVTVALLLVSLLCGCGLKRMGVLERQVEIIVRPPENPPALKVGAAQTVEAMFPWAPFIEMLGTVLPYPWLMRMEAMREKVTLEERRNFSLFNLQWKDDPK